MTPSLPTFFIASARKRPIPWSPLAILLLVQDLADVDPTKVVRAALQGAASVAGLLITTEAMVAELPQTKGQAVPSGGGMGGNY
jgi:hypothetical protein